jgi:hypothetical protein
MPFFSVIISAYNGTDLPSGIPAPVQRQNVVNGELLEVVTASDIFHVF